MSYYFRKYSKYILLLFTLKLILTFIKVEVIIDFFIGFDTSYEIICKSFYHTDKIERTIGIDFDKWMGYDYCDNKCNINKTNRSLNEKLSSCYA